MSKLNLNKTITISQAEFIERCANVARKEAMEYAEDEPEKVPNIIVLYAMIATEFSKELFDKDEETDAKEE